MLLSGHLAQTLGEAMEDEFAKLLEKLGYRIVKRQNVSPSFDFIADFPRRPLDGSAGPSLRSPWFSPAGRTAFSIKEGFLKSKDVAELRQNCQSARRSGKPLLKRISGGVLVTNEVLLLYKIDRIRKSGIYCWDMRRLLFYSAKARIVGSVGDRGRVVEFPLELFEEASCLLRPGGRAGSNITLNIDIFLDDHRCNLSADDVSDLLREAHRTALAPAARKLPYSIDAILSLHVLGMVDPELARKSYDGFRNDHLARGGIVFAESSQFRVYQYGPTAWSSLL